VLSHAPASPVESLFSVEPRDRELELPAATPEFDRLDRRLEPWAARVRALMDDWFTRLPNAAQTSIRPRFTSPRREAHLGAFHELYQHELAVRGDYDIDCDIGVEDPEHVRPDLLVSCGGDGCFVEVTVALGDDVVAPKERPRVEQLYDAINRVPNRDFLLSVAVRGIGAATPGRNLTGQIARWLDGMDADREIARVAAGGAVLLAPAVLVLVPPETRPRPDGVILTRWARGLSEASPKVADSAAHASSDSDIGGRLWIEPPVGWTAIRIQTMRVRARAAWPFAPSSRKRFSLNVKCGAPPPLPAEHSRRPPETRAQYQPYGFRGRLARRSHLRSFVRALAHRRFEASMS
jgi:hypothetical protein